MRSTCSALRGSSQSSAGTSLTSQRSTRPEPCSRGARRPAQRGQQQQQVGLHRLERIDRELQVVDAFAQHGRHLRLAELARLGHLQRAHQLRAHAVVDVLHQPLALAAQHLALLHGAQRS
jgi:hypothetical protein